MESELLSSLRDPPAPYPPWDVLVRPLWKDFWKKSFLIQENYTAVDRWSCDVFLRSLEIYIHEENEWRKSDDSTGVDTFLFSSEEKDAIILRMDPWKTGLITVEQINFLEEFFSIDVHRETMFDYIQDLIQADIQAAPQLLVRKVENTFNELPIEVEDLIKILTPRGPKRIVLAHSNDNYGNTLTALRLIEARKKDLGIQSKYMHFYCDVRACYSPNAIICQLAHSARVCLLGDQDPHSFFVWIRQQKNNDFLFVIDNLESSPSALTSLGAALAMVIDSTTRMKFLALSVTAGLKNALVSCGVQSSIVEEVSLSTVSPEKMKQWAYQHADLPTSIIDGWEIPTTISELSFCLNAFKKGYVSPTTGAKHTTTSILKAVLDYPMKSTHQLNWLSSELTISMVLHLLQVFRDFFELEAVISVFALSYPQTFNSKPLEHLLSELIDRRIIEEISGRGFGKRYTVNKFVREHRQRQSVVGSQVKEVFQENFCKYHASQLSSAGRALAWGNTSAAFSIFDLNHSDMTTLYILRPVQTCINEYVDLVKYAHQIIKMRISASDQVTFYTRILELLQMAGDSKESTVALAYVNARLSEGYQALDDAVQANRFSSQATSLMRSYERRLPEPDVEFRFCMSLVLEREAESFANSLLLEEALDYRHGELSQHPDTCNLYYLLGKMLEGSQKSQQAIDAYQQGFDLMQKLIPNHLLTALCGASLALLLRQQGKLEDAVDILTSSIWVREEVLGHNHPLVGQAKYWLALTLLDKARPRDLSMIREVARTTKSALQILSVSHEPGHYETMNVFALWTNVTRKIARLTPYCQLCSIRFSIVLHRHRCRACGRIVCSSCSPRRGYRPVPDMNYHIPVRVCFRCSDDSTH
eukprot:TRINITY_DN7037_c0_g1_i2.p1 TRINITY_DN7037_c0_g1~~TRINITY_DN7037_c0_g1_i2.p1  ORF type:complete len:872 (+),score=131.96 TRINITY_DN7037_c0_g1_i2:56-2671(+)